MLVEQARGPKKEIWVQEEEYIAFASVLEPEDTLTK